MHATAARREGDVYVLELDALHRSAGRGRGAVQRHRTRVRGAEDRHLHARLRRIRRFLTLLSDGERLTGAYALEPEAGEWTPQATRIGTAPCCSPGNQPFRRPPRCACSGVDGARVRRTHAPGRAPHTVGRTFGALPSGLRRPGDGDVGGGAKSDSRGPRFTTTKGLTSALAGMRMQTFPRLDGRPGVGFMEEPLFAGTGR
jgi:hypothetical protein